VHELTLDAAGSLPSSELPISLVIFRNRTFPRQAESTNDGRRRRLSAMDVDAMLVNQFTRTASSSTER
jgi:hypothetical protein